jgi:hypothetical protein
MQADACRNRQGASMNNSYKLLACGAAIAAVSASPAPALAKHRHRTSDGPAITGVVVHENNAAGSFVVAERSGRLDAVHGRRPPIGAQVRVRARKLADGTFAERSVTRVSRRLATRARVAGVVSADDPATHEIVVSSTGASMAVDDSSVETAGGATPGVGETIDAEVELGAGGELSSINVSSTGTTSSFRVEGKVLAVDDGARTLELSSDDDGATGSSLIIQIPDTIDVSAFAVGDCVELTVIHNPDGSLIATADHLDGNVREADGRDSRGGSGASDGSRAGQPGPSAQDPSGAGSDAPSGSTDSRSGSHDGSGGSDTSESGSGHGG